MQSKNQVVILDISIFEKPEQTFESNCLADQVRKKRPPSYFGYCQIDFKFYSLLIQCSERVQSKNKVDLVEVSVFISRRRRAVKPFGRKR